MELGDHPQFEIEDLELFPEEWKGESPLEIVECDETYNFCDC